MVIGETAKAAGVSTKMIRHYEQIGLLAPASRKQNGYRVYDERDVHALRFIRRARDLGFSIEDIAGLLALWRDRTRHSADVKRMALDHAERLRRKVSELQAMLATLDHLAERCAGDARPDCPILTDLEGSARTRARRMSVGFGAATGRAPARGRAA